MALRRRHQDAVGVAARRPHAGRLRRERRLLLRARERAVVELGGLTIELYRRGGFRDDLLAERCSIIVGIDARLAEIDELLHAHRNVPRCECGAPILRGSKFCPNCGRSFDGDGASAEATIISKA